MQLIGGRPVYSATDLVGYLACQRLTTLDRSVLIGALARPRRFDADLDVLRQRGFEHEHRYLEELARQGKRVVEIQPDGWDTEHGDHLVRARDATEQAMADGWDVIYQGTFFDGHWRGHPDFLLRVDDPERPSRYGPYHYEVADTKLARRVKAGAVLQVCSYVDHLERAQSIRPTLMHIVLGGSSRRIETLRVDDFMAYYRSVLARFESEVTGPDPATQLSAPEPEEHCSICRWEDHCEQHRRSVDHLSFVAGISARQRRALADRGITTLAELGTAPVPFAPPLGGSNQPAGLRVREQARIQLDGRDSGKHLHELLRPVEPNKGLACLPTPCAGDLFLDLEGDPFGFEDGLDYLFGVLEPAIENPDGTPLFHSFWSTDADGSFSLEGEKRAFEATVDLIMDRLATHPDMHVYHYAPYEPTAFKRLMSRYGTREDEVDRLLRGGVLVDLYRAVRQGLRASVESYSIKKLEPLYGFQREVELRDATSSIVAFEQWLALETEGRPGADHLERILQYNRDDVISTWQLRDWLERQRILLAEEGTDVPRPQAEDGSPPEELGAALEHVAAVATRLTEGVPVDPIDRTPEQQARWLLAQLLSWHRREEKSDWWLYYHLLTELTDEERIEAKEPLGGTEFVEVVDQVAKSTIFRYRFPPQEHDLTVGNTVHDPATERSAGTVYAIDEGDRFIDLKRGNASKAPHPTSLVPLDHVDTKVLQGSLLRLGEWVADHPIGGDGPFRAARDLLMGSIPRLIDSDSSKNLKRADESSLDAALRLGLSLDHSVLPIQGPPGAGKTYIGAHMITRLLAAGRTVGITANSHRVIGNLLTATCSAAREAGVSVRAIQKTDEGEECVDPFVTRADQNAEVAAALASGTANLVAGTAWLWARPEMAGTVDFLFIDEAGQLSLANALAVAPATRSMVLLGDPLQLDQPIKGSHPPGVAVSALGHLLGADATIPPDRGLFLEETWRLHPDLCDFTSAAFYEGRLTAESHLVNQRMKNAPAIMNGTGPRVIHIEHAGNDNSSIEEAQLIAAAARQLVEGGATWIDRQGVERAVGWDDVLVVAAYNAQVAAIRSLLPEGARVGTVDKFQGQEAPITFYSMASSTPADAPRGMTFLYNRHRLNVATSRARCVAVVVCSSDLLRVRARTMQEMRLANAVCEFVARCTLGYSC